MEARHPSDGAPVKQSQIYIAPPDRHLMIEDHSVRIIHGPKENRSRPAIDPLFRSAALTYGPRVIGVVLSGSLDDGTSGLRAISKSGGLTIVQDPADALYPAMPESAIYNNSVDHIAPAVEIANLLRRFAGPETCREGEGEAVGDDLQKEVEMTRQDLDSGEMIKTVSSVGKLSMFTCPECHGTLWEIKDGQLLRYRCHVGHAFSIDSLDEEQAEKVEAALWSALRALEERGALSRRLANQAREQKRQSIAQRYDERADEADEHAGSIREMLLMDAEQARAPAR